MKRRQTLGPALTAMKKPKLARLMFRGKFVHGITPPCTTNYALRSLVNFNVKKRYEN